jgi:hypothetical protein
LALNSAGNQFFAGAGLTENKYSGICEGYLADFRQHGFDGCTLTDNVFAVILGFYLFLKVCAFSLQLVFLI